MELNLKKAVTTEFCWNFQKEKMNINQLLWLFVNKLDLLKIKYGVNKVPRTTTSTNCWILKKLRTSQTIFPSNKNSCMVGGIMDLSAKPWIVMPKTLCVSKVPRTMTSWRSAQSQPKCSKWYQDEVKTIWNIRTRTIWLINYCTFC